MFASDAILPRTSSCSPGSIRNLELRDLPHVARLLVAHHIDPRTIDTAPRQPFPRHHVLVLDIDGAIRALAYVVIAHERALRGHLQLLIIDPALVASHGRAIEDRLAGVAVALCEAYGCAEIDIVAAHHDDTTDYPVPAYAVG